MNRSLRTAALVALLALAAIGITQSMMHGQPGVGGSGMPGTRGMPGTMMAAPNDELGFLQHMIPHHREAIETAEALLAVTERPELRDLLEGVIETQSAEIALMQDWIAAWYPDADPEAPYAPMMRDLGSDATVADRERAWLEDMVMHHMIAVRNARLLLAGGLAEHPEVEALARDVVVGQTREMQTMSGWLGEWFGVSGMPGMMGGQGPFGAAGAQGPDDASDAPPGFRMLHGPSGMHGGMMHPGFGGMGGFAGHGTTAPMSPTAAEALARAFLAGRGDGGSVVQVSGPRVTYEVTFEHGDRTGVLIIDAQTGEVSEAPTE